MVRASVRSRCRRLYANTVPDAMPGCQPPGDFRALALPLMSEHPTLALPLTVSLHNEMGGGFLPQ